MLQHICVHNDKQQGRQGYNMVRNDKVNGCPVVKPFVIKSHIISGKVTRLE